MIELTRLNGGRLIVNADLIKYVEASPDTLLTLITGEKIVVRESCADVVERSVSFRQRILQSNPSGMSRDPAAALEAHNAYSAYNAPSASSRPHMPSVEAERSSNG